MSLEGQACAADLDPEELRGSSVGIAGAHSVLGFGPRHVL